MPPTSTAPPRPRAGGLPVGMGGHAVSLLSGGIDSPVSSYMIAKRGVQLDDDPLRLPSLHQRAGPGKGAATWRRS